MSIQNMKSPENIPNKRGIFARGESLDLVADVAEIIVDGLVEEEKEVPHSFRIDQGPALERKPKYWYCSNCGMRNKGRLCVDCGTSRDD